jgi:sugar-specific transcriptional regulator TrmB
MRALIIRVIKVKGNLEDLISKPVQYEPALIDAVVDVFHEWLKDEKSETNTVMSRMKASLSDSAGQLKTTVRSLTDVDKSFRIWESMGNSWSEMPVEVVEPTENLNRITAQPLSASVPAKAKNKKPMQSKSVTKTAATEPREAVSEVEVALNKAKVQRGNNYGFQSKKQPQNETVCLL